MYRKHPSFEHLKRGKAPESPPRSPFVVTPSPIPSDWRKYPKFYRDYEVIQPLGSGSFAQCILVRNKKTGKLFTCKMLKRMNKDTRNEVDMLIRVSQSATYICNYVDRFVLQRQKYKPFYCIMMDYIEGFSLEQYITNIYESRTPRKYVTDDLIFNILESALSTLALLHSLNIAHRDIKPDNYILTSKPLVQGSTCSLQLAAFLPSPLAERLPFQDKSNCPKISTPIKNTEGKKAIKRQRLRRDVKSLQSTPIHGNSSPTVKSRHRKRGKSVHRGKKGGEYEFSPPPRKLLMNRELKALLNTTPPPVGSSREINPDSERAQRKRAREERLQKPGKRSKALKLADRDLRNLNELCKGKFDLPMPSESNSSGGDTSNSFLRHSMLQLPEPCLILIDFGLGAPLDRKKPQKDVGTPNYYSPDLVLACRDKIPLTKELLFASDIWGLGACMYYLCTGREVASHYGLSEEGFDRAWDEVLDFRAPRKIYYGSSILNDVIRDCLTLKYSDRPTAKQLLSKLNHYKKNKVEENGPLRFQNPIHRAFNNLYKQFCRG